MKSIYLILTLLGFTPNTPTTNTLSFQEKRFVNNVVRVHGSQPAEIIKLPNGRIAVNYPDQRIILGADGFIHDLEILEGGVWIDMGPEY
jgi:hypothetical protein